MRDSIPDGGKPVAERTWGQNELNKQLKSKESNPDTEILGTEVGGADAMRFTGMPCLTSWHSLPCTASAYRYLAFFCNSQQASHISRLLIQDTPIDGARCTLAL